MMPRKKCSLRIRYKRLYGIWASMKTRCNNMNCEVYKDYGGRGIEVCEEWAKFENFFMWAMNNGYDNKLTIDRIDNNGNYEPNNCRWDNNKIQSFNQRVQKHSTPYAGITYRKKDKCYEVCIGNKYIGRYNNLDDAYNTRKKAEIEEYGFNKEVYSNKKYVEVVKEKSTFGENIRKPYPKLYNIWCTMKMKCYNSKDKSYKNYGNLGIQVHDSWHKFDNFLAWALEQGYKEGLKLNRFDINKDFCKDNCYFSEKIVSIARKRGV